MAQETRRQREVEVMLVTGSKKKGKEREKMSERVWVSFSWTFPPPPSKKG